MYSNRLLKVMSGIILLVTCLYLSQATEVYAGNINSEESRLMEYVNRTFEQDGLSYKVNASYIAKLRNKLMQDDIDLTASDVEMIIGEINNNVATGVDNGYLVLIETPTPTVTDIPEIDESTQGTTNPSEEANGETGSNGKETETNVETETNGNETDTNGENKTDETETNNQGNSVTNPDQNNSSNDLNDGKTDEGQTPENGNEEITIPLKNTGYSLESIPYIAAVFVILMLVGILSLHVLNYVEVSNESKK